MASGPDQRFPKKLRVRTRPEFLQIQNKGARLAAGPLLALWLRNGGRPTRVGLTVSSKVGGAVLRVRLRRQLREIFRRRRGELPDGADLVLVARPSAAQADYDALDRAFGQVASKLKGVIR